MTRPKLKRLIAEHLPPQPKRLRGHFFHHPCHDTGPLTLEWAAAAYERMQAQRDFIDEVTDALGWSWDDPYVRAAHTVEQRALAALQHEWEHGKLTYAQRQRL